MDLPENRAVTLQLRGSKITVLGTLKGLVSERELVRKAVVEFDPEVIGIHIGKEEMDGLAAVVKGKVENTYLSSYEKVYARELSKFGEVMIPPPSLVEAFEISRERKIPLKDLDFGEQKYASIYTELINGVTMVRQSLRLKSVNKRKFRSETPEEFILEWDRIVNKYKGFRSLEAEREKKMVTRIDLLSRKHGNMLAIVEYERMEGIVNRLSSK